jgi:hypothetical protein
MIRLRELHFARAWPTRFIEERKKPCEVVHLGLNMALVEIVHDDVQCNEEGCEIEVQGILLERKKRADHGFSSKPSALI